MNNQEIIKNKEQLTSKELEEQLMGDYPQHSALYVLAHLDMVADGAWDEDKFFKQTEPDLIMNTSQYIDSWCKKRNVIAPDKLSEDVVELLETIDSLVVELKEAIMRRDSLKSIYQIVRRFEAEAGIKMQVIPGLED